MKTTMQPKILSVTLHHEVDTDPDLSWIGEYSRKATSPDAIDRFERVGDYKRGEYRWFNPAYTAAETDNPESPEQDYQCMEAYNRQEWWMIGIYASAQVQVTERGPIQRICSGGLWGIESNSDEEYFKEVELEQLVELREQLEAIGLTVQAIDEAFKNVQSAD